ncbi:eukaryotic translation initiation factor 3 subunit C-like [Rhopilema esculentum]|uniref:eukaryotic translation initiation factor 3 subunit C-like n=1 Tax=Rhopilema esculentum TaxID=499914 RepID=UPI0031E2D447
MSKFFMAGSSSSESEDSDVEDVTPAPRATRPVAPSRFLPMSDDEDDVKRTVRSLKDKRFEEIHTAIKQMRNSMKIKDIAKVMTEWENMCKAYIKAKTVVEKEGIPAFYIKALADLEDFIQNQWEDKESRQKLSKVNAKSLSSLRQKMKKYNRDFEEKIKDFKENPEQYEEEEAEEDEEKSGSESDDSEDEAEEVEKPKASSMLKQPKQKQFDEGDEDDDDYDSFFEDEGDEDETSSDDELPAGGTRALTAAMFLKTEKSEAKVSKKQKKEKIEAEDVEKADRKTEGKRRLGKEIAIADHEGFIEVTREKSRQLFPKDVEINHQAVLKKLQEILAVRGKKSTDKPDQVGYFKELKRISDKHNLGPGLNLKITFNIMAALFDSVPTTDTPLKPDMWKNALEEIQNILTLLEENEGIQVGDNISDDAENVENQEEPLRVRGCPFTVLERLYTEFLKILQNTDCHSTEYVDRLRDEALLTKIILRMQSYLEKTSTTDLISKMYLLRIEHIYYKLDMNALKKIREQVEKSGQNQAGLRAGKEAFPEKQEEKPKPEVETEPEATGETKKEDETTQPEKETTENAEEKKQTGEDNVIQGESNSEIIDKLCKYVYTNGSDRVRTRSMLCHIYHHALHDRLYEARDLILISHLQETIQHSDIPTQILYNRTMVQLGLCAFRHGMIRDAHNALLDVQSTNRVKELLAQGLMNNKNFERSPEQEKIEKRRLVPFHMHINLELLECVYLTSALLLEIPYMAAREYDSRRRIISKSFRNQLRNSDRQPLVGPPETMREHIVAAAKAMKKGDWKNCSGYILAIKSWNLFSKSDEVKEMLKKKIKEESLRTYLFTYNKVYDSISMHSLAEMFELPPTIVHSIVSKMIIGEELQASWDEPTQTLILHHGAEPTLLQSLTLQLADKIGNLAEQYERITDFKHGGYFDKGRQGRFRHGRQ